MQDVSEVIENRLVDAKARQKEANLEVRQLERVAKAARSLNGNGSRPKGATYDPEAAAGEENIEAVRILLETRGTIRQVEATRELGLNSGTVSCAFQALEKRKLAKSGPRVNRSIEWTYTGKPKAARVKARKKETVTADK